MCERKREILTSGLASLHQVPELLQVSQVLLVSFLLDLVLLLTTHTHSRCRFRVRRQVEGQCVLLRDECVGVQYKRTHGDTLQKTRDILDLDSYQNIDVSLNLLSNERSSHTGHSGTASLLYEYAGVSSRLLT